MARNPERIRFVVRKLEAFWLDHKIALRLTKKWKKVPDQRLLQVAENYLPKDYQAINQIVDTILNDIKKGKNIWWNLECDDLFRDYELLWWVTMNKNWDRLEKPYIAQLQDLTEDHLKAIVKTQPLSDRYFGAIMGILWCEAEEEIIYDAIQSDLKERAKTKQLAWISSIIRQDEI